LARNILNSKISIPPISSHILFRPGLIKTVEENLEISQGFSRPFTLISAPAGFGKTTLARALISKNEGRSAWFSLDQRDNERNRFWLYLISSLQSLQENTGRGTLEILSSAGPGSEKIIEREALLAPLLNDLFYLPEPYVLVVDDYHLINNSDIHEDMIFFLENLPPGLHLVVTTRSEPPWPIARWRARGQMGEIRQKDLRFSLEETGQLFSRVEGLKLQETQIDTLYQKTEGWVTGLQLAAISLAKNPDPGGLIKSFAGSHRHVFHFLSEEVFNQQPENLQDFLLQTSILSRFSASLCDAVTSREDSSNMIFALERDNIFLNPLDHRGEWFRYHHLFADLLFHKLKESSPGIIPTLHYRAANWFLEKGEPGEAIRYAQKADNQELVAEILDKNLEEIIEKEGPGVVIRCLDNFSSSTLKKYPQLAVQRSWFHLVHKGIDEAMIPLEMVEELLRDNPEIEKEIGGMLGVVRAYFFINSHRFPEALEAAEKALELLPEDDFYWRSKVGIISGDARLFSGNPREAYGFYHQAHLQNQKSKNLYLIMSSGFKLATTLYFLGRLKQAEKMTRELLEAALEKGFAKVPRIGLLWTLLGELEREQGSLKSAREHIEKGIQLSQSEKPSLAWNLLFKIALNFSEGDYSSALKIVEEIETLNSQFKLPNFILQPALAWKARLLLRRGEKNQAQNILSNLGIAPDRPVKKGQEKGFLVLAESMENDKQAAVKILLEVQELALQGENRRIILEAFILKSRLEELKGHPEKAEESLKLALEEGLKNGYQQIFLDSGRELISVLTGLQKNEEKTPAPPLAEPFQEIMSKIIASPKEIPEKTAKDSMTGPTLPEKLSSREIEILGLLAKGNSNKEVAEILFLSPGTIKWHTSNIYGKLGVKGRTHAIARARELNLIPRK